jgi:DNA-binding NtrC family response regulator
MKGKLLIVDDNKNVLTSLKLLLSDYFDVFTLTSPNRMINCLREEKIDVVLLDMNFTAGINTGNEGFYWLSEIRRYNPAIAVVLFTAYAEIDLAVRALKEGATDFVVKPWNNAKIIATLLSAYRIRMSDNRVDMLKKELSDESELIWGTSSVMEQAHNIVQRVAQTDANVLITGENGTGKELIARELHRLSSRANKPLVTVDAAALTESLFESELFGHLKGSFTDAQTDRTGKFDTANGGTLFLDEIGNIPYHLQAKLLTVLQNREITKVGSNNSIPIDIRLISATNCNLSKMAVQGKFREDLLYRINTVHIATPSLRERKEDIIQLADFFLNKYTAKYRKPCIGISAEAREKLTLYSFPGNVRELQHAIEKAVILCDDKQLQAHDFLFYTIEHEPEISDLSLDEMERRMIQNALVKQNGNLSAVATQLKITRQTLYNKMKKYGL